ncbi:MAG: hypothetical protein HYS13_12965 [Planctomycetia bacterium]|nr:hypothetical protein [Planctomycetia bacterium]
MPPNEFDLYLSLLGKLLRLRRGQQAEIADEIRDHLAERFEELTSQGVPRENAVRQALDEFGDAASLATHFTQLVWRKRRRTIMRCTFGTVGACAAVLVLLAAFWPANNLPGPAPATAVAQQPGAGRGAPGAGIGAGAGLAEATDELSKEVEAKLEKRMSKGDVAFAEVPLRDGLDFISDYIGVDILIKDDGSGAGQATLKLQLKHSTIKARTLLELMLEQTQPDLDYVIRDGLIYITNTGEVGVIQVYNCRDLLAGIPSAATAPAGFPGGGGLGPGGGLPLDGAGGDAGTAAPAAFGPGGAAGPGGAGNAAGGAAEAPLGQQGIVAPGGFGAAGLGAVPQGGDAGPMGGGMFGMGMGGGGDLVMTPGQQLVSVIESTIEPNSWANAGGQASITEFNGLIIVKHRQSVHQQIAKLLEMMRKAHREQPGQAAPMPGGIGNGTGAGGSGPGGIGAGAGGPATGSGRAPAGTGAPVPVARPKVPGAGEDKPR